MRRNAHSRAGYTFIEIMVALVVTPLLVMVVGQVFGSSNGLLEDSYARLRAHEDLRSNLEAVANALRDADIDTLDGFDAQGVAVSPTFQRVVGFDDLGRVYSDPETLEWRPTGEDVDGITDPGVVVRVRSGVETVIAKRVPRGGFQVRLAGNTLAVHVTTYAHTSAAQSAIVSGSTAISLRN